MRTIIAILAISSLFAGGAIAQPQPWPELIVNRLDSLGQRFVYCSAFFYVVAYGIKQRGDPDRRQRVYQYIRHADLMREKAATISAQLGQTPEIVDVRWERSAKDLWAEMGNRYENFSIVMSKHKDRCVSLYEDPTRHMREAILGQ